MSARPAREQGFGLVEVVIAMFLLLIIAVALLSRTARDRETRPERDAV